MFRVFFVLLAMLFSAPVFSQSSILCDEVTLDPLGRGYSAMTITDIETSLREKNLTEVRPAISREEVISALVPTDILGAALTESERLFLFTFIGASDSHDPRNGSMAHSIFVSMLGGTQSLSNLGNVRNRLVSRQEQLGLANVSAGDIQLCQQQ